MILGAGFGGLECGFHIGVWRNAGSGFRQKNVVSIDPHRRRLATDETTHSADNRPNPLARAVTDPQQVSGWWA